MALFGDSGASVGSDAMAASVAGGIDGSVLVALAVAGIAILYAARN